MHSSDLSKKIVITGVTRGLGRALVSKFIDLGHSVYGCGRNESIISNLNKQFGPPHLFCAVDVVDFYKVSKWTELILNDFGLPDILINNAAIINTDAPLWEISAEEYSGIIDVNIKGVANVMRAFLPTLVKNRVGKIINFSSGAGKVAYPNISIYCATKFAVEGMTQAVAQELPSGMIAVPLSPGIINTDMLRSHYGERADEYQSPDVWVEKAAQFILDIGIKDNGKSLIIS